MQWHRWHKWRRNSKALLGVRELFCIRKKAQVSLQVSVGGSRSPRIARKASVIIFGQLFPVSTTRPPSEKPEKATNSHRSVVRTGYWRRPDQNELPSPEHKAGEGERLLFCPNPDMNAERVPRVGRLRPLSLEATSKMHFVWRSSLYYLWSKDVLRVEPLHQLFLEDSEGLGR